MSDSRRMPGLDEVPPKSFFERYGFGLILSAALTALLLWLDMEVVTHPDMGYGGIALALVAIFVGGPLAVALLITWSVYMIRSRGNMPGKAHLLMFVPPLLSLFVIPLADDIRTSDAERFRDAHPAMTEIHVNLSGKPLWLAPDVLASVGSTTSIQMPMKPAPWASFVSFTRYPDSTSLSSGAFPYDGVRLRDGVSTYTYGTGETNGQGNANGRSVSLVQLPYPDLQPLASLKDRGVPVVHQYFHYGDRVEVAPTLNPPVSDDELRGKVPNLVRFYLSHRLPPAIARLEVGGQTLAMGAEGPIEADASCRRAYASAGYALTDLGRALKLRWQTLDNPWQWHEASLTLPALPAAPRGMPTSLPSVLLYFPGGDRVSAERFQMWRLEDGRSGLQATGLPADVQADQVCGSAVDAYGPQVVTLPH